MAGSGWVSMMAVRYATEYDTNRLTLPVTSKYWVSDAYTLDTRKLSWATSVKYCAIVDW